MPAKSSTPSKPSFKGPTGRPCYPPPAPKLNGPRPNPGGTKNRKRVELAEKLGESRSDLIKTKGPTGRPCTAPPPPKLNGPRPNPSQGGGAPKPNVQKSQNTPTPKPIPAQKPVAQLSMAEQL